MAFYTPLRYPGGKGKLSYYIKAVIEQNSLSDGEYFEPYAGGAGVALELLMQEYVRRIHINDIDPAIHGFWYSVLNETDSLCKMIHDTPVTMDVWQKQKAILCNMTEYSVLEIGFAAFFLNRTNRSGILKAGAIGGKEQSGKWKLNVRYQKNNLLNRIKNIADYQSRISLYNMDSAKLIKSYSKKNKEDILFYLDPPYYDKGQDLYRNFYNHQDHLEIMNLLKISKIKNWIVSYDNTQEIKEIYNEFRTIEYSLQYTAQSKKIGKEVMIFSDSINIPNIQLGKSNFF